MKNPVFKGQNLKKRSSDLVELPYAYNFLH